MNDSDLQQALKALTGSERYCKSGALFLRYDQHDYNSVISQNKMIYNSGMKGDGR